MAWQIRSLAEASQRVRGAFRQYMPGTDAALKNNFVTVTGKVLAALSHEFELRMAYLARQLFASTASAAFLARHGSDVGIFRKAASPAIGLITGSGAPNAIYPAGIRFVSGDVVYVSTTPASASPGGDVTFSVQAQTTGAATNRDAGGVLGLADPVLWPFLGAEWAVSTSGLGGGADREGDDALRERILFRKRNPPGGGRLTDYENAALSVPGVVKAWAFRQPLAPGFISVFFLFAGRPNLIPTPGDVAVVQAAIDATRLIRIDDNVAVAPTPEPLDLTISGLANDSAEVRVAIEAAVAAMLVARARPGVAGDAFTLSRSWISEAISRVSGEDRHVLDWPLDDVTYTNGRYPVLGTVTYAA
ncbi:Baseplate J family protein [Pseudorhizobium halotolerans]|uniref:Baseplate J family protein n=1 Tax=Pseudorhizobium halotolerans TaxID=1233081 RepID=A0ABM8PLF0_9HYPH|nr:baseplate J/gp47 family protein [Pseudorhizobium halotolerans]CAD7036323.1 Baseplate J family protein [Pseudorhizobium halotolerans]